MTTKKFTLGRTPREATSQRGRQQETETAHVDHFVAAREPETTKTFRLPVSLSRRLRLHAAPTGQTEKEILIRLLMEYLERQMKSGGWQLKQISATRYSEIVFYVVTVMLSYSFYHLFSNTQAGARFADKTRQALAFAQLRSRRRHVMVYAGGYFEIFETLSFAHLLLQLPTAAQERLRHWLDEHLRTVTQRE